MNIIPRMVRIPGILSYPRKIDSDYANTGSSKIKFPNVSGVTYLRAIIIPPHVKIPENNPVVSIIVENNL